MLFVNRFIFSKCCLIRFSRQFGDAEYIASLFSAVAYASAVKAPIDDQNNWGIYQICCQCGLSYIGQSNQALKFRVKEHQSSTRNRHSTSQLQTTAGVTTMFLISKEPLLSSACQSNLDLDFFEALHVRENHGSSVNDLNRTHFSHNCWSDILGIRNLSEQPGNRPEQLTNFLNNRKKI